MTATNYIWDFATDSYLMEKEDGGTTTAVYTNEPVQYGSLISQRREDATNYYHFDGLGSTRQLSDQSDEVTNEFTYSAFGETVARSGTTFNRLGFIGRIGYDTDTVTNDMYVRRRLLNSLTARWLQVDPLIFRQVTDRYLYAANNPLNKYDPSGRDPIGGGMVSYLICTNPVAVVLGGGAAVGTCGYLLATKPLLEPVCIRITYYITDPWTEHEPAPDDDPRYPPTQPPPPQAKRCVDTGIPICRDDLYKNPRNACAGCNSNPACTPGDPKIKSKEGGPIITESLGKRVSHIVCYFKGNRKKPCPKSVFCGTCCKDVDGLPTLHTRCKCA